MKLGDLLVASGTITEEQLHAALLEQKRFGGRLGDIIAQRGFCTDEDVARAVSRQLALPYVNLGAVQSLPDAVLQRIPYELALKYNVVPCAYRAGDNTLVVAMANARDRKLMELLARQARCKVSAAVASTTAITRARARLYGAREEMELEQESAAPGEDSKFTDSRGRTMMRNVSEMEREHRARKQALQDSGAILPALAPTREQPLPHVGKGPGPLPRPPPMAPVPPPPPHSGLHAPPPSSPGAFAPFTPPPGSAPGVMAPPLVPMMDLDAPLGSALGLGSAEIVTRQIKGFTDEHGRTVVQGFSAHIPTASELRLPPIQGRPVTGSTVVGVPVMGAPVIGAPPAPPAAAAPEPQAVPMPSPEQMLAMIAALQEEVRSLKAVAVVLFHKNYITMAEYQAQMGVPPVP